MTHTKYFSLIVLSAVVIACGSTPSKDTNTAKSPKTFDEYWYNGDAEITSYKLEQARYGEVHNGTAVTVFVTEDFSKSELVKLDDPSKAGEDAVPVLKLNLTKKFNTGVYPYSMMTSVFTPVDRKTQPNTLKVTTSSQEWCGHTFTQLELADSNYNAQLHSYFESEGEQELSLEKTWLEDELWNLIRIAPKDLPTGEITVIPSTMFQRLKHTKLGVERANGFIKQDSLSSTYTLTYPQLDRELIISFRTEFPHQITSWNESYVSGWGEKAQKLTTKATLIKSIKLDYWNKHDLKDAIIRKELGLE